MPQPVNAQLFFEVWVMNVPSCGVTFVPLHVGHVTLAFPLSEKLMVSSNGFLHFSHRNSYLGMVILPDQFSSPTCALRDPHLVELDHGEACRFYQMWDEARSPPFGAGLDRARGTQRSTGTRQRFVKPRRQARPACYANSASACASQNRMSISRNIVVAVVRDSRAS